MQIRLISCFVGALASAALFHTPASLAAPGDPLGAAFQVDSGASTQLSPPGVARNGAGEFVVVWRRAGSGQTGTYARAYGATGTPRGPEIKVPLADGYPFGPPAVAIDGAGNFVVAATSESAIGSNYQVQAQRYAANGSATGTPIVVASIPKLGGLGYATPVSLAMDADGDFVLAWSQGIALDISVPDSAEASGGGRSVYARRYGSNGTAKGAAVLVSSGLPQIFTSGSGPQSVAMADDGSFVIAWNSENYSGDQLSFKRYNAAGKAAGSGLKTTAKPLSDKFPVHAFAALDAAGNFTLLWSEGQQSGNPQLVQQRYSAAGKATGGPTAIGHLIGQPSMQPDGAFVLAGTANGTYSGVLAQRYAAGGTAEGGAIAVDPVGASATAAVDGYGNFVVVWGDAPGVGTVFNSIHARLYSGN